MTPEDHRFPCDNCGSDMRFDPGRFELHCDHCGNTAPIYSDPAARSDAVREHDFLTALDATTGATEMTESRVSRCPNCGAEVEFDPDIHATECPYCATPVVTGTGAERRIKPAAVLPFVLDEESARDRMTDWLGSLWFAPNGLTQYARKGRRLSGVYTPCWTFDADTKTAYRGQRGTVHTKTRTVTRNGKPTRVTTSHVTWRPVSGRVARFFDDVLVLASTALPERFRAGMTHWDLTRLEPYMPEYLAGFRAEAYTIALDEAWPMARGIMDRQIARDIKFDIGGDRQKIDAMDTAISDVTYKHILVPLWLAAYKYRGKSFRFVVNGQTGEVQGERPWSAWKLFFAFLLAAIVAGGIGYLWAKSEGQI
ncbi:primosomal protein N' (replication factor Y) - superfamily II helicase [Alphaproteobacteria bacterium GH1-50]|uniref:Primosomal protein N' (Replication factor Y)-superfamily II helicase n=1 Tax=Kangsaoukella pontilimi TaxID=2691042 RepID=A0A7C9IE54_9RHOB|nr:zinc ribbon domain-containing protein [Kangsaoukella pontilimi]MXQ06467.1 primosomal protein N' (replication factor Y) - superfamily II helicase [Kangsaoukella pontilimi]